MKCAVHSDVDATGYCRNCGKPMCGVCSRPVHEVLYCEDCLATVMGHPPQQAVSEGAASAVNNPYSSGAAAPGVVLPPPNTQRVGASPVLAFFLGFFPGLGAVYNGEYNKALIHIVLFTAMIFGLTSDAGDGAKVVLSLLLAGFIFYMAIDAMRTARAKALGETISDPLEVWSKEWPVGPIILIGIGALFLLNNFHVFDAIRIGEFWPIILIGIGILMFKNRLAGK